MCTPDSHLNLADTRPDVLELPLPTYSSLALLPLSHNLSLYDCISSQATPAYPEPVVIYKTRAVGPSTSR